MVAFRATKEITDLLDDIRRVRGFKKDCEDQEKRLLQQLYNKVNEHDRIIEIDADGVEIELATWKYSAGSKRFDSQLFKDEHSDMYEQYCKIQPGSRTLRIKE